MLWIVSVVSCCRSSRSFITCGGIFIITFNCIVSLLGPGLCKFYLSDWEKLMEALPSAALSKETLFCLSYFIEAGSPCFFLSLIPAMTRRWDFWARSSCAFFARQGLGLTLSSASSPGLSNVFLLQPILCKQTSGWFFPHDAFCSLVAELGLPRRGCCLVLGFMYKEKYRRMTEGWWCFYLYHFHGLTCHDVLALIASLPFSPGIKDETR